jgi:hypothetical protein
MPRRCESVSIAHIFSSYERNIIRSVVASVGRRRSSPCPQCRRAPALPPCKGKRMSSYVLGFRDVDKTKIMVVGGKGANLGEASKLEGICVPNVLHFHRSL